MHTNVQLKDKGQVQFHCPMDDGSTVRIAFYRFQNNVFVFPSEGIQGQMLVFRRGKLLDRVAKFATFKKALKDLITKTKSTKTEVIALEL
jgi:hypothetical protein